MRSNIQRQLRDFQSQVQDLKEDLVAEREARKQNRKT